MKKPSWLIVIVKEGGGTSPFEKGGLRRIFMVGE